MSEEVVEPKMFLDKAVVLRDRVWPEGRYVILETVVVVTVELGSASLVVTSVYPIVRSS